MKGAIGQLYGTPVHTLPKKYLEVRVQFRFPKSKKKRIRKKWEKREENFRIEERAYLMANGIVMSDEALKKAVAFVAQTA